MRNKVIMGIGIPGSGKSIILKKIVKNNNYLFISPDDIRLKLTGQTADQSKNKEVWEEAYRLLGKYLKEEKTVVFDATFANQEQRVKFIDFCRERGVKEIQGLFLDIPLETAKERNRSRERRVPEYVLERMEKMIRENPPQLLDGLDALFYVDEEQNFKEVKIKRGSENEEISKKFNLR